MFYIITAIMDIIFIGYSFYQLKNGPTERERVGLEKFYKRTLAEEDIKSYKARQKFVLFALIFALISMVLFVFR